MLAPSVEKDESHSKAGKTTKNGGEGARTAGKNREKIKGHKSKKNDLLKEIGYILTNGYSLTFS